MASIFNPAAAIIARGKASIRSAEFALESAAINVVGSTIGTAVSSIFNRPNSSAFGVVYSNGVGTGVGTEEEEYTPHRTLKNSVASSGINGGQNSFAAQASDIPDNFATNEQPKTKFLFTVQFFPRSGLKLQESGSDDMTLMRFALKKAGRPNPSFTYQDVNFYSFRTKVAVKLDYGTVALSFYDDVVNNAHNIVSQYINYMSPIASLGKEQADLLAGGSDGARSIGAMVDNVLGPFQAMRVTHHMLDNNGSNPTIAKQVFYDYLNPKIVTVNLDELDMSASDVSMVDVTFVYDSVNITYSDAGSYNPSAINADGDPISYAPPIIGQSSFVEQPFNIADGNGSTSSDNLGGGSFDTSAYTPDRDYSGMT